VEKGVDSHHHRVAEMADQVDSYYVVAEVVIRVVAIETITVVAEEVVLIVAAAVMRPAKAESATRVAAKVVMLSAAEGRCRILEVAGEDSLLASWAVPAH
jgi:hypothetical protein